MVQKEFELVTWGAINALYQLRIQDSKNSADDEIDDGVQNPMLLINGNAKPL